MLSLLQYHVHAALVPASPSPDLRLQPTGECVHIWLGLATESFCTRTTTTQLFSGASCNGPCPHLEYHASEDSTVLGWQQRGSMRASSLKHPRAPPPPDPAQSATASACTTDALCHVGDPSEDHRHDTPSVVDDLLLVSCWLLMRPHAFLHLDLRCAAKQLVSYRCRPQQACSAAGRASSARPDAAMVAVDIAF